MTSTAAYHQGAVEIIGLNLCGLTVFGHNKVTVFVAI